MCSSPSQRRVARAQDLTGQTVGGPAYPSTNVANSSPLPCLLGGEGPEASQPTRRKTAPARHLSLQGPLPRARPGAQPTLTSRLVLAAHKAFVAFIFQQLEQIGEVQLSRAAGFPSAWDLCHLHVPWEQMWADVGGVERVGGQRKQHGRLGRSQERGPHQRGAGTSGCSLSGSRP